MCFWSLRAITTYYYWEIAHICIEGPWLTQYKLKGCTVSRGQIVLLPYRYTYIDKMRCIQHYYKNTLQIEKWRKHYLRSLVRPMFRCCCFRAQVMRKIDFKEGNECSCSITNFSDLFFINSKTNSYVQYHQVWKVIRVVKFLLFTVSWW